MRNIVVAILAVSFFSALFSCRKNDEPVQVDVELLAPKQNELLLAPDTLTISFELTAEEAPELVAVSIVNRNYTPLFGVKYVDSPGTEEPISVTMIMRALPDTDDSPYYILITPKINGEGNNHFFPVQLSNKPLVYQGFYLFSKPSLNRTSVIFYNTDFNDRLMAQVSGNYAGSSISGYYGKLFFITDVPAKLRAYSVTEQQLEWEAQPLQPYPVYTDVKADADRIYAAMGNGQIIAHSGTTGQPKLVAERLVDSIPELIALTDECIVAYYRSRINGRNSIISFYKVSGVKKHRYPIDFEPIAFLDHEDRNKTVVCGNSEEEGVIAVFSPCDNLFVDYFRPGTGKIETACNAWEGACFYTASGKLYSYQWNQHRNQFLIELNETPVGIKYEKLSGTLFVVNPGTVVLYAYPQMSEISKIIPEGEAKEVRFFYKYE